MQQVGSVTYERQPIADHAINLASTIQSNLKRSLEAIGVVRCQPPNHGLPNALCGQGSGSNLHRGDARSQCSEGGALDWCRTS